MIRTNHPVTIIMLFSLGWAFMYADRNILSPVMVVIGDEWGLNKLQLGLMSTVFFIAYAAMQIPAGFLADRFGRLKVLVIGYILFGIGTILSGLAPSFGVFLLIRAFTGFGEGTYYGPVYAMSSSMIPAKYRGISSALINSGMAVGISLGFIASSYFTFTLHKSWQFTFYFFGVCTIVVSVLIAYFIRDNHQHHSRNIPEKDQSNIKLLFTRNHILAYVVIFCSCYGFFGMLTWLPYYLQTVRGLQGSQTGIISSLVPWASIPGAIIFAYVWDRTKSRKPLITSLFLIGALCQFLIPYVADYSLMIAGLVVYGFFGKLALDPLLVSYVAEHTPSHMYSRAFSLLNFAGMLSSIFAPYITGYFAQVTGKVEIGFYLSGVLLVVGGILFLFTTKDTSNISQVDTKQEVLN